MTFPYPIPSVSKKKDLIIQKWEKLELDSDI